jgi:hypothetical protein
LASASSKLSSSSSRKHSKEQQHQQQEVHDTTMAASMSSSTKAKISSNNDHRFLQQTFNWVQVGSDIDGGETIDENSGRSVAMSGDGMRVVMGAPGNNANGIYSGHARVYKDVDGDWIQVGSDIDGEAANDLSGYSVAMSDDGMRVIVGAPLNQGIGMYSGHARVYKEVDGDWVQMGSDIAGGEAFGDRSGWSVAMSDDGMRVIMGAPYNQGNGGSASGHARVYKDVDGDWIQVGSDIDGKAADDHLGCSVAMSDDGMRVVVGARGIDDKGRFPLGHARVYKEVDGDWIQVGSDIDGETIGDRSGYSVSMSDDGMRVVVGGTGTQTHSGHARVYKEVDGDWIQVGSDIDGEAARDRSGYSVAMSGDGMRVIMGAPDNDGNGIYGYDSGHARVYKEVDGDWVKMGSDIDGEAADDLSGYSVAMSDDGMRVIVGAPGNNANVGYALASGHARVFQVSVTPMDPTMDQSSSAVSWSLKNTNTLIGLSLASVCLVLDGGLF